jgi:transcriptional regulator with XRE-family HTH domain
VNKNLKLKVALTIHPEPAYCIAFQAGMRPDKISKIICGVAMPTDEEKKRLAKILGRTEDEIFPAEKRVPE